MKMTQQLATKGTASVKTMPSDLREKLNGLTINEALERGIIDDLGDNKGNFFFKHADDSVDATYAIVQGYGIIVSKGLAENQDDVDDQIGDLRFTKGISTIPGAGEGKEFFRLGLPAGLNLGEATKALPVEPGVTA